MRTERSAEPRYAYRFRLRSLKFQVAPFTRGGSCHLLMILRMMPPGARAVLAHPDEVTLFGSPAKGKGAPAAKKKPAGRCDYTSATGRACNKRSQAGAGFCKSHLCTACGCEYTNDHYLSIRTDFVLPLCRLFSFHAYESRLKFMHSAWQIIVGREVRYVSRGPTSAIQAPRTGATVSTFPCRCYRVCLCLCAPTSVACTCT